MVIENCEKELKDLRNNKILKSKLYSYTDVMALVSHIDNKWKEGADELLMFLEADLWTKFKPLEIVNGKMYKRQDYFESEEKMIEYLKGHFSILKKEQNK